MCSWQSLRGPALPVGRKGLNRRLEAEKAPPEQTKDLVTCHLSQSIVLVLCLRLRVTNPTNPTRI